MLARSIAELAADQVVGQWVESWPFNDAWRPDLRVNLSSASSRLTPERYYSEVTTAKANIFAIRYPPTNVRITWHAASIRQTAVPPFRPKLFGVNQPFMGTIRHDMVRAGFRRNQQPLFFGASNCLDRTLRADGDDVQTDSRFLRQHDVSFDHALFGRRWNGSEPQGAGDGTVIHAAATRQSDIFTMVDDRHRQPIASLDA